ncbi:MAG: response regulator transcription factor [Myxococcaceae bacterium]|nr:response regulator transcription factor [Myxococcaceae bacterium]
MADTAPSPVRVALVEDHPATREALVRLLEAFPQRARLVCAVPDAESFLRSGKLKDVQVVLADLMLPGKSGSELIAELSTSAPELRCLALTAFDSEQQVLEAIRAGAYGYLLKDEPPERLVSAVEEAAAGAHPVSSRVAGFLFTHTRRAPAPVTLSDREEELARALADGLSYQECAARMGIAIGTVQDYVKRLYRKLDVSSKKEVRAWVSIYGLRPGST